MENSDRVDQEREAGTERQAPLKLRWRHKRAWRDIRRVFHTTDTGAAIILATLAEHRQQGRWVSYSRDRGHYSSPKRYRDPLYSYRCVVGAVDQLAAKGWIFHDRAEPGRIGWQSAFLPTREMIERAEEVVAEQPRLQLIKPNETVILRGADGKLLDYPESRRTSKMRRELEALNEITTSAEVSCPAPVVRIFNKNWQRNGRIYAVGGGWQSMPKEQRQGVTIKGEPVVEIDYKNLHPAILYAMAEADMPADCYALPGWDPSLRKLIKVGVLITLNARNKSQARYAIAHHDLMEEVAQKGSEKALWRADRLIDDIKRTHAPIAHYFHCDMGAELMQLDSELAKTVMLEMSRRGEVVLPVHDSFLVRESKADQLEEVMFRAAYEKGLHAIALDRATGK